MNSLISLVLAVFFIAGCGRQSNPIPETKDSYPRTYPNPCEVDASDRYSVSKSTSQINRSNLYKSVVPSAPRAGKIGDLLVRRRPYEK